MSQYEKSVKGATKIKLAPPKSKYIEHILQATRAGEGGVGEVFRTLNLRLRDSTWTIAFKALIVVHLMIRDGQPDVTLSFLSNNPRRQLGVHSYADGMSDVQTQGKNIRTYSNYLIERARSFQKARVDYVSRGEGRLKRLGVEKGLLRETESVQEQIQALLSCDLLADDVENEITLTAFRLLIQDLLVLFQVMNEGTINVLEHYFEMSRPDAERALSIYKTFCDLTRRVVQYLKTARDYESTTRVEIPKIRHAPTSLAASLEEYLNDQDFETNRRQYLAQQEAKRTGKPVSSTAQKATPGANKSNTTAAAPAPTTSKSFPDVKPTQLSTAASQPPKGPAPDLIDFFESIEFNQQTLGQEPSQQNSFSAFPNTAFQQPQQQTAFYQQPAQVQQSPSNPNNPFGGFQQQPAGIFEQQQASPFPMQPQQTQFQSQQPQLQQSQFQPQQQFQQPQQPQLQSQYTEPGFGGFGAPQQTMSPPPMDQNQGASGPFGPPQFANTQQPLQQQATNPFRQSSMPAAIGQGPNPFNSSFSTSTPTGSTNPFAKSFSGSNSPFTSTPLQAQQTQSYDFPQAPQNQNFAPQQQSPAPLGVQQTGTNPFAKVPTSTSPQASTPFTPTSVNQTGSTNPFKQSAFVNQQTGQGWQSSGPQPTVGGIPADQLGATSIFPRPGGQAQTQTQTQTQPWGFA